ncbi:MAG: hypothetical protein Q8N52_09775, partial [Acidobacteriota bacterium]|nr:hypothetical protein [Acidobacteriota bacterium]
PPKRDNRQGEFVIADASEVLDGKTKADVAALSVGRKVEVEFFLDGAKKIVAKAKVSGPATTK